MPLYLSAKIAAKRALCILIVGITTTLPLQSITPSLVLANTATWVDGDMPRLDVGEKVEGLAPAPCYPSVFVLSSYTKQDGSFSSATRDVPISVCATSNGSGFYGNSGGDSYSFNYIKPFTGHAYPIVNSAGDRLSVMPVPGQKSFILPQPDGNFNGGRSLRFYDSFPAAGSFEPYFSNINQMVFKLAAPYTAPLKDSAGSNIYMMDAYGFSPNGLWMVVEADYIGIVRINTQTREMQLVRPGYFQYGMGWRPSMSLAISDDGNSVVQSIGDGDTIVHDLSGCQPGPFASTTTNKVTGCRNRSVRESLKAQLSGFRGLSRLQFSADGKSVTGRVARINASGTTDTFAMTYSVAGYQPPQLGYLALGDSFSSGEGAFDYEQGTDNLDPANKCHLSRNSYSYLAAKALGIESFHSVACSGAKSSNYDGPQNNRNKVPDSPLGYWLPGYQGQKKYFERAGNTSAITVSMIGNDIGFDDKVKKCVIGTDSCFHFKEDRESVAYEIYSKFDTLVGLYSDIKSQAPKAKIFVLGYPRMFASGTQCQFNVRLDAEERAFSQGLVTYLNAVIKAAAEKTGVQYIDVEHAFSDKQHCDSKPLAVNGLTAGNDAFISGIGPFGNESFHPNKLGHQLFSQALLAQSNNLTRSMPTAAATKTAPYIGSAAYDALIGTAPGGGKFSRATYTALQGLEIVYKTSRVVLKPTELLLKPRATFQAWFNSEPTYAGALTSNDQGELSGEITIPSSLTPGYHTLHIYGQNVAGEDIDLYKTIYVAASESDLDGDGIANTDEKCLAVEPANVDYDRDGTDDACDGEITEPPADSIAPTITGTPDRQPNADGWHNQDVTIAWSANDPEPSSGAPTVPAPTVAAQEGANTYTSAQSCDPAGNCATGSLELKLDKTAPDISFSLSQAPTTYGWNNTNVTVTFNCSDGTSGVASCTEPVVVSGNGIHLVTGAARDKAGNMTEVNAVVSIDSDNPTVSNAVTPVANGAGWHHGNVTVTPECNDAASGVAKCSQAATLANEGMNQLVISEATDRAGNTATAVTNVHIDKTAPALGTPGWTSNPKEVAGSAALTIPASDNLSGIAEAEYFLGETDPGLGNGATMTMNGNNLTTTFGTDFPTGVWKVSVRAKDRAGNWSAPVSDYLVVYNPSGVRMTGKKTVLPALNNGDMLPGLISNSQTDTARFGFSVRYDDQGQIHKTSDFQFSYKTGTNCTKPAQAQDCRNLELNAAAITWLTTQGPSNTTGIFQGTGTLLVDGASQPVSFRVTGLDGERLNVTSSDHLTVLIYAATDNPNTATPLYRVSSEVTRGTIRLRTP